MECFAGEIFERAKTVARHLKAKLFSGIIFNNNKKY